MGDKQNCTTCECNHCLQIKMDEAFEANGAKGLEPFRFGSAAEVTLLKSWPKFKGNRKLASYSLMACEDFPKAVGVIKGDPIWYLPSVEKWIEEHQREIAYIIRYETIRLNGLKHLTAHLERYRDEEADDQEVEEDDIKF